MYLDRRMSIRVHSMVVHIQRKNIFKKFKLNEFLLLRIGLWQSNGIPITNNIVYKTYQSAIVINGKNNRIEKNLVSTVYWSGTAQPQIAEFNINYDGAIMSRDAISVIMKENLIAGVERIAYRIQGNSCSNKNLPDEIVNDYENNEAHSAMAGVVLWPQDIGFQYDTSKTIELKLIKHMNRL